MNTKSKLIAALSAVLAVTAGAAATSTFAWIRTTRTSTVNLADGSVYGDAGMSIEYVPVSYGGVDNQKANAKNGFDLIASAGNMTDVSGNGIAGSMYRPDWDPNVLDDADDTNDNTAVSINAVANDASNTYYICFGITFKNGNLNDAISVYLNGNSSITNANDDDASKASAKSARMSFWNDSSLYSVWQANDTDPSYTYLKPTEGGSAYNVPGFSLATPDPAIFHAGGFSVINKKTDAVAGQKIIDVPKATSSSVPGTTTVFASLWFEGTVSTSTIACVGGHIKSELHFIAFNA